jgi:hypothetical protein
MTALAVNAKRKDDLAVECFRRSVAQVHGERLAMALPEFNSQGDLPEGVHRAPLDEILARFGGQTPARRAATASLLRIHHLAKGTGNLERFIIFGSYITTKAEPNDVDIVLVMADDFQ